MDVVILLMTDGTSSSLKEDDPLDYHTCGWVQANQDIEQADVEPATSSPIHWQWRWNDNQISHESQMVSSLFLEYHEESVKLYDDEVNCGDRTNGNNKSEWK